MCSYFGILLAFLDINNVLRFTTQQSEIGKEIIKEYKCEHMIMKSIIICDNDTKKYYVKSKGILYSLYKCNYFLIPFLFIFYLIPYFIRDWIYDFISIRRHKLVGTKACKLPPKYFRKRILE